MIVLIPKSRLARWFVWSCDHLPLTAIPRIVNGKVYHLTGSGYMETGTSLCHLFWAALWVPLIILVLLSLLLAVFVEVHLGLHMNTADTLGVWGYFLPEMAILGACLCGGLVFLMAFLIHSYAGRVRFLRLLWTYIKCLKQRVCPLVRFEP